MADEPDNKSESDEETAGSATPDFAFYSGIVEEGAVREFLETACQLENHADCVVFFLTTYGGDPHAAFKLMRGLQAIYENVTLAILGPCKSAGTLAALGADSLVFGVHGELGPLDVQVPRADEIAVHDSGLEAMAALATLTELSLQVFESHLLQIINKSMSSVSMRTASHIAAEVTVGLLGPIASQIDPHRLGKIQRAVAIAKNYGDRLSRGRGNVKPNAIGRLVNRYPDHAFVIDAEEAKTLFEHVGYFDTETCLRLAESNPALVDPQGPRAEHGFINSKFRLGQDPADEENDEEHEGGPHGSHTGREEGAGPTAAGTNGDGAVGTGDVPAEPGGRGPSGGPVSSVPGRGVPGRAGRAQGRKPTPAQE